MATSSSVSPAVGSSLCQSIAPSVISALTWTPMTFSPQPRSRVGPENPNPGSYGTTASNAGAPSGAMTRRVAQRTNHRVEAGECARPSVRHEQRQRTRLGRTQVDEMHGLPVDLGHELRQRVEPVQS